ncbi:MAG: hypothetical protein AAFP77_15435 [Bacteroidota bacterium]
MQKAKVILVVVGLLLIGFTGGFLTNRHFVQQKVHQLRRLSDGEGFGEMFLKRIDANPEQTAELREVFQIYGPQFRELGRTHREERKQLADSLFQELNPLLSEEQLYEVERWRRMLVKAPHHGRRGRQARGRREN